MSETLYIGTVTLTIFNILSHYSYNPILHINKLIIIEPIQNYFKYREILAQWDSTTRYSNVQWSIDSFLI